MADDIPLIRVTDVRLVIGLTVHVLGEREPIIRALNEHSLGTKLMDFTVVGSMDGIHYPMSFSRSFVMYVGLTHDYIKKEEHASPEQHGIMEVQLG